MNLFTKQKESHRCRQQVYGHQRGNEGRGINWEPEMDTFILRYITNKNLPCSTRNSPQNSTMTSMRKEFLKEWIYAYV